MTTSTASRERRLLAVLPEPPGQLVVRRCLEAAVAAPSVHNSQPWRFRVRATAIEVLADWERRVGVIDPTGRELLISVGAAILNLRVAIAAHGRQPLLELLPDGDTGPAARITPGHRTEPKFTVRALAAAIPRRHTNRLPFRNVPVPYGVLRQLGDAAAAEQTRLSVTDVLDRELLLDLLRAAERAQRDDPRYLAELASWTRPVPDRRDGVPHQVFGPYCRRALVPVRQFQVAPASWREDRFEPHPTLVVLSTTGDGPLDWLRAGQALERVLLTATALGLATTPMSQVTELPELRPLVAGPAGWVPQLVLRLGYGGPAASTPRRPVNEITEYVTITGGKTP
jgi:nitroreductase